MLPVDATSQDMAPPEGFLTATDIIDLLRNKNFDDLHSLENSDGKRIKPLHENEPFLAETYDNGKYEHYDEDGLTDTAEYYVEEHSLCLNWKWTNNEKLVSSNGVTSCYYIEKRGNCYLPQRKSRFARAGKEIKSTTFIFLKYGDEPRCEQEIS